MKENKNTTGSKGSGPGLLLKNGLIVDGSGRKGYPGDLLIKGPRIEQVSQKPIKPEDCASIDCTGLVIAPGFIDAHSQVSLAGFQNPASFGSFPLVLQYARDRKLVPLEEAVRRMTGATAERFNLKERGFLKKGYAADITVFDWQNIRTTTR